MGQTVGVRSVGHLAAAEVVDAEACGGGAHFRREEAGYLLICPRKERAVGFVAEKPVDFCFFNAGIHVGAVCQFEGLSVVVAQTQAGSGSSALPFEELFAGQCAGFAGFACDAQHVTVFGRGAFGQSQGDGIGSGLTSEDIALARTGNYRVGDSINVIVEIAFLLFVDRSRGIGQTGGILNAEVAVQTERGEVIFANCQRVSTRNFGARVFVLAFYVFDANDFHHIVLALLYIIERKNEFTHLNGDAILLSVENNVEGFFRKILGFCGIRAETEEIALDVDLGLLYFRERIAGGGQFIRRVRILFCAIAGESGGEGAQAQREGEKGTGKMLHKR